MRGRRHVRQEHLDDVDHRRVVSAIALLTLLELIRDEVIQVAEKLIHQQWLINISRCVIGIKIGGSRSIVHQQWLINISTKQLLEF